MGVLQSIVDSWLILFRGTLFQQCQIQFRRKRSHRSTEFVGDIAYKHFLWVERFLQTFQQVIERNTEFS